MADEMTPGEIGRTLHRIDRTTDQLKQDLNGWRDIIIRLEHQVEENSKDIAQIQEEQRRDAQNRRQSKWDIFKAVAAPIIVAGVLAVSAWLAALWMAANRGLVP